MAYIPENWANKNQRAALAVEHTNVVAEKYKEEIAISVANTVLHEKTDPFGAQKQYRTRICIINEDTVGAIFRVQGEKVCALNFASFKHPGGMFLNGSRAQEECLCHESFLYNVLKEFPEYYRWNFQHANRSLYADRALYSPHIVFERDGQKKICDILTCAAPNKSAAQQYCGVSDAENTRALKSRIQFLLSVAAQEKATVLILGAYGCGVFGQDPAEVAAIFRDTIRTQFPGVFEWIVYAIPDNTNGNLEAFRKAFSQRGKELVSNDTKTT